jgi:hypothetical protein
MNYMVTGVLSNPDVTIAKVTGIPAQNANPSDAPGGYSSDANVIGYDWNVSDPETHAISLVDSVSYFVKSVDGNTYQMYFTNYGGLDAGTVTFKTKLVE